MKKAIVALIVFLALFMRAYAQTWQITPSFHCGTIVKSYKIFPEANSPPNIIGLNVTTHTKGKKLWQQLYRFPQAGIAAYYINTGNNEILGHGVVIAPNLILHLNKSESWPIELGFYTGYAYLTKAYDPYTDPSNNVIGSHFNFFDQASIAVSPRLSKSIRLTAGVGISHLSNGRLKDPDLGINIPNVFVALRFNENNDTAKIRTLFPKINKRLFPSVRIGIGAHDYGVKGSPLYYIYTGSVAINKRFSPIFKMGVGVHFAYITSTYYIYLFNEIGNKNSAAFASRRYAFPVLNAEWFIGHVALNVEAGPYLFHPVYTDGIAYAKFGFLYYLQKTYTNLHHHIAFGMMVQATTGRAEFPEVCVQYCF